MWSWSPGMRSRNRYSFTSDQDWYGLHHQGPTHGTNSSFHTPELESRSPYTSSNLRTHDPRENYRPRHANSQVQQYDDQLEAGRLNSRSPSYHRADLYPVRGRNHSGNNFMVSLVNDHHYSRQMRRDVLGTPEHRSVSPQSSGTWVPHRMPAGFDMNYNKNTGNHAEAEHQDHPSHPHFDIMQYGSVEPGLVRKRCTTAGKAGTTDNAGVDFTTVPGNAAPTPGLLWRNPNGGGEQVRTLGSGGSAVRKRRKARQKAAEARVIDQVGASPVIRYKEVVESSASLLSGMDWEISSATLQKIERRARFKLFGLYFSAFMAEQLVEGGPNDALSRGLVGHEFSHFLMNKNLELERMGIRELPFTSEEIAMFSHPQQIGHLLIDVCGPGKFKISRSGNIIGWTLRNAIGTATANSNFEQLCLAWEARSTVHKRKVITYPDGCVVEWAKQDESMVCLVYDFEVTRYWPEGGKYGFTKGGLTGFKDAFLVAEASAGVMYAGVGIGPVCVIHPQQRALEGNVHWPTLKNSFWTHMIPPCVVKDYRASYNEAVKRRQPPVINHDYLDSVQRELRLFCEAHVPRPTPGRIFADDPRLEMEVFRIFIKVCRSVGDLDGETYWSKTLHSLADITQIWARSATSFALAPHRKQNYVHEVKEIQRKVCRADDICQFHNIVRALSEDEEIRPGLKDTITLSRGAAHCCKQDVLMTTRAFSHVYKVLHDPLPPISKSLAEERKLAVLELMRKHALPDVVASCDGSRHGLRDAAAKLGFRNNFSTATLKNLLSFAETGTCDGDLDPLQQPSLWRAEMRKVLFEHKDLSSTSYHQINVPKLGILHQQLPLDIPIVNPRKNGTWLTSAQVRHFQEKGFLVVRSVFFLDIVELLLQELKLYAGAGDGLDQGAGWIRCGWGTPGQVLVSTDPILYAMYCQLRDTSQVQVGFHESKYQRKPDRGCSNTGAFTHVDINMFKAYCMCLDEKEKYPALDRIQMVMCVSNQGGGEGFKLVPYFHKDWFQWIKNLNYEPSEYRRLASSGTAVDLEKHGKLQFTTIEATKGSVIFFSSMLPHGCSKVTSDTPRAAMFPCLLARSSDDLALLDQDMQQEDAQKYHDMIKETVFTGKQPLVYANGRKVHQSSASCDVIPHIQLPLDIFQRAMLFKPSAWNNVEVHQVVDALLSEDRLRARMCAMKIRADRMIGYKHAVATLQEYKRSRSHKGNSTSISCVFLFLSFLF